MDKYEYNLKIEQLKKYASEGFFDEEALEICESINWKKEKDVAVLSIIGQVYEKYRKYEKALFVLERIYKLSSAKRRNAYRIINVALEYGDFDTANEYLVEYKRLAPKDTKCILLEYRIAKGRLYSQLEKDKNKSNFKEMEIQGMQTIIPILEGYVKEECDEVGMYELAEAYHRVGKKEECIAMCDQISIWFSFGTYVEKALRLKTVYVPLSDEQREMIQNRNKYEQRLKEFVNDLNTPDEVPSFVTKEEAKERAEKKAEKESTKEKKEKSVIVMTSLEKLDGDRQNKRKEVFAEHVKSIHNKSEKVSIDSLENVRKMKDDYVKTTEEVKEIVTQEQVVEETKQIENKKQELKEQVKNIFSVDISEELDVSKLGDLTTVGHFVVQCDNEKKGMQLAAAVIGECAQQGKPMASEVAYTSGEKLNEAGVEESLEGMNDVVVLVKHAGALTDISLWDLHTFMEKPNCNVCIALIDTADGIEGIWKKNFALEEKFQSVFVAKTMTVDELADHAVEYAESKNCVLHDMAYIPLYDIIEAIVEEKKGNEKKRVENFMDYVIENASGRKIIQIIRNIFFMRQDDQGKIVLYEKDFE